MPKKPPPSEPRDHDWSHFLIQNTPGAVITADQEGRVTEWNRAAERLTGFSRDEAMGRPAEEVVRLRGDDVSTWKQVLQGQKEITEEVLLSQPFGSGGAGDGQFLRPPGRCAAPPRAGPSSFGT